MEKNEGTRNASLHTRPIPIVPLITGILISLALLGTGFVTGRIYERRTPQKNTAATMAAPTTTNRISLPKDVYKIQSCQGEHGLYAEYAQPQAIPHGPIYLTYQQKIVGIEYMVDKAVFSQKNISFPHMPMIQVDHVTIHFLPNGHPGYEKPHYHIDFYQVNQTAEKEFSCDEEEKASTSATLTATPSATTVPVIIRH